jgi:hypothetical protein
MQVSATAAGFRGGDLHSACIFHASRCQHEEGVMGVSLSFLAIKGRTPEEIHRTLGLSDTGVASGIDADPRPMVRGAALPNGWYLILFDDITHPLIVSQPLARTLSGGCEVVCGQAEEHDMYSACFGWRNSAIVWSVVHDARKAPDHLYVWGAPPARLDDIEAQAEAQAAQPEASDVDFIFEIPVELAYSCCGWRYDQSAFDWGTPAFTVLAEGKPPRQRTSLSPMRAGPL